MSIRVVIGNIPTREVETHVHARPPDGRLVVVGGGGDHVAHQRGAGAASLECRVHGELTDAQLAVRSSEVHPADDIRTDLGDQDPALVDSAPGDVVRYRASVGQLGMSGLDELMVSGAVDPIEGSMSADVAGRIVGAAFTGVNLCRERVDQEEGREGSEDERGDAMEHPCRDDPEETSAGDHADRGH
jgi:hypothetical protein